MSSARIHCHGCKHDYTPRSYSQHVSRSSHPQCHVTDVVWPSPSVFQAVACTATTLPSNLNRAPCVLNGSEFIVPDEGKSLNVCLDRRQYLGLFADKRAGASSTTRCDETTVSTARSETIIAQDVDAEDARDVDTEDTADLITDADTYEQLGQNINNNVPLVYPI